MFAQSFNLADILYWVKTEPAFAAQAVYLDDRYEKRGLDPNKPETWKPSMTELKASGVKILAPPIYTMLALNEQGRDRSVRIRQGREGCRSRSDRLVAGARRPARTKAAASITRSVKAAIDRDGDTLTVLDVLAKQVGVRGMFSDWPATTTFYASCMGMK